MVCPQQYPGAAATVGSVAAKTFIHIVYRQTTTGRQGSQQERTSKVVPGVRSIGKGRDRCHGPITRSSVYVEGRRRKENNGKSTRPSPMLPLAGTYRTSESLKEYV
ncbi:unnamed protein product [Ectocarpus sp. 12 AP-2014]